MIKPLGIVRRIDDLGRIAIPKDVRRTLQIREGDPMEVFISTNEEVILRKYHPIGGDDDDSKIRF